ncbi:unnamed protein product, partial [Prorocentrum cordatum]
EVKELDVLSGWAPRAWYSTMVNLDEAYSFLGQLGLTATDARGGAARDTAPSQHASTLNTLIGTGKLQSDTRTSGSYGSVGSPAVNVAIIGNWHWKMLMAVERGHVGNHVAATKERSIYCAGPAAKRHEPLPADFEMPRDENGVAYPRWTWLPLTARLADSFGWSHYYQEPDEAERDLEAGPLDEAEGAGYSINLPDGVEVRLRYRYDAGTLQTQCRISARWMLPSPYTALVPGVRRVIGFFKTRPHFTIPFEPTAREHLLGAQLEQSLLASASRGEDGPGEAQHGAAAGQIGVWAGLLRILRMAAADADPDPATFAITTDDVDLSTRIVQISLQIKKLARQTADLVGPPDDQRDAAGAVRRPVRGDYDRRRFAPAYLSQAGGEGGVGGSPAAAAEIADAAGAAGGGAAEAPAELSPEAEAAAPGDAAGHAAAEEAAPTAVPSDQADIGSLAPPAAAGQAAAVALPAAASAAPPGRAEGAPAVPQWMDLADLEPMEAFFKVGMGENGAMLIRPDEDGKTIITDRHYVQRLFLLGADSLTVPQIAERLRVHLPDPPAPPAPRGGAASRGGTVKKTKNRWCVPTAELRSLMLALAADFPRICTFVNDVVAFRDFPEEVEGQVKMHAQFMKCAGVTLHEVSEARVQFLKNQ